MTGLHEQGATIVYVTHPEAYAEYAQRIIRLFDGHIVSETWAREKCVFHLEQNLLRTK